MATHRDPDRPRRPRPGMTLDEFRDAEEEEGYRYELARGVLEVTEVPNDPHGLVVCESLSGLCTSIDRHPSRT